MKKRVAVIGAGPSGLAQLRAFQSAANNGEDIPEVVCFEKQDNWGGLWNYTWRTGLDENGEPVHCSMYRYLWSNGPKEGLEFADYSFEEHFGKQIASYPPRAVLYDYIEGRVKKADVRKWIRFSSAIRWVEYNEDSGTFTVTVHDHEKDSTYKEEFDHVICASGHFSTPSVPFYEGFDTFNGRVLHAHDFRDAREFTNKDVLILGASYSAEDIGSQCWKYGCKSVTTSYRSAPMGFDWPDNWDEVPALVKIDGNTAHFIDGTQREVDAIILCTGYKHYFSFLPDDLRLKTANRLAAADLYKGVVYVKNPKMFYLGMQDQWFTFNMFDAQAWYARDLIMGRLTLPDGATMDAEWQKWRTAEEAIEPTDEANIRYQADYVQRLQALTDYPTFDIEGVVQCFLEWEHNKHVNIMTFRDHAHRSLMTGNMAPVHHTPWLRAYDDSIAGYVEGNKPGSGSASAKL